MAFATASAASGPSTRTTLPPVASVASMSARRGRVGDELGHGVVDGVGERRAPRHEHGGAAGSVLGLGQEVDRHELGSSVLVGDHDHLRRAGAIDPDDARHLALGRRHVGVPRADDHVDRPDRLRAVGHRGDRLGAADPVHLVDADERRRGQRDRAGPAVGVGRHAAARPRPRRRRAPGSRSSAPSTDSPPARRARSSPPGRPARRPRAARTPACSRATSGVRCCSWYAVISPCAYSSAARTSGRHGLPGGRELGGRHAQLVDRAPVEALRESRSASSPSVRGRRR